MPNLLSVVPTQVVQQDQSKQQNTALAQQFNDAIDTHAAPIVQSVAQSNQDAYDKLSQGIDSGVADPLAVMPGGESPFSFSAFSKAVDSAASQQQAGRQTVGNAASSGTMSSQGAYQPGGGGGYLSDPNFEANMQRYRQTIEQLHPGLGDFAVAQARLETGNGRQMSTAYNYGNVGNTDENPRGGASYGSPEEAGQAYVRFLTNNGGQTRYQALLDAASKGADVPALATLAKQAGYATDPDYAAKIAAISAQQAPGTFAELSPSAAIAATGNDTTTPEADTNEHELAANQGVEPVTQYTQRAPGGLGTFETVTKNASGNYDVAPAAQPTPDQEAAYNAREAATSGFTNPDINAPLLAGSTSGAQEATPSPINADGGTGTDYGPPAPMGPPAPTQPAADQQAGDNPLLGFILHPDQHLPGFLQPVVAKVQDLAKTLDADVATVAQNVWASTPDSTKAMITAAAGAASQAHAQASGFESPQAMQAYEQATGSTDITSAALKALSILPGGKLLDAADLAAGAGALADEGAGVAARRALAEAAKGVTDEDFAKAVSVGWTAAQPAEDAAQTAGAALAAKLGQVPADMAAQQAQADTDRLVNQAMAANTPQRMANLQRAVASMSPEQQDAWAAAVHERMGLPAPTPIRPDTPTDDLSTLLSRSVENAKANPAGGGRLAAEGEPVLTSMGPGTASPADIGVGRPATGDPKLDGVLANLQDNYLTKYSDVANPDRLALKAAAARESLREAQGQILDSLGGLSKPDAAAVGEILAGKASAGASDAAFQAANKVDAVRQVVNDIAARYSAAGHDLPDLKTTMQGINEDAIPALLKVGKGAPAEAIGPGGTPSQRLIENILDWHEMLTGDRPSVISPKELQQYIDERGLKGLSVVNDPGMMAAKYVSSAMTPLNDLQFADRLKTLATDAGEAAVSATPGAGLKEVPNVPAGLTKALIGDATGRVYASDNARSALQRYIGRDVGWNVAQDHPKVATALTWLFDKPKNALMQTFTLNPATHIARLFNEGLAIPDAVVRGAADAKAMTASASARMDAVRDGLHLATSRTVAGKLAKALDVATDLPVLKTGNVALDGTLGRLTQWNHQLVMQTAAQDLQMAIYSGLKAKGWTGEAAAKVANTMTGQLANSDFGPITNWVRAHVSSTPNWGPSRITLLKTAIPGLGTKGAYLKGLSPEEQKMVIRTVQRVEASKAALFAAETGMAQQVMAGHFLPTAAQIKAGHALDADSGQKDANGQPIYYGNKNFDEISALPKTLMRGQGPDLTPLQRSEKLGRSLETLMTGRLSGGITEPWNMANSLQDQKLHPYLGSQRGVTPLAFVLEHGPYVPGRGGAPTAQSIAAQVAGFQELPNGTGKPALPPKYFALTPDDKANGRFVTDPKRQTEIEKAVQAYTIWTTAVRSGNRAAADRLKPDPDTMRLGATYISSKAINPAYTQAGRENRVSTALSKASASPSPGFIAPRAA